MYLKKKTDCSLCVPETVCISCRQMIREFCFTPIMEIKKRYLINLICYREENKDFPEIRKNQEMTEPILQILCHRNILPLEVEIIARVHSISAMIMEQELWGFVMKAMRSSRENIPFRDFRQCMQTKTRQRLS